MTSARSTDVFIFHDGPAEGAYAVGQVKFTGEAALFRRSAQRTTLSARSCRSFSFAGQELFSSPQPADIDIAWSGRSLIISAPPGSRIHSTGIGSATINGQDAQISGKADFLVVP